MNRAIAGAVSGLAATYPMTLAMVAMHRKLPPEEQYPLPPRQITMEAAEETGVKPHLGERERRQATLVSHFGFGGFMGLIYGLLFPRRAAPPAAQGLGYGILVWLVNYLGVLPALGSCAAATREPPARNALMIIAHLVFGLFLAAAFSELRPPRRRLNSEAWSATKRAEDLFP
jgi:uncharacterized membrane protein YagU involved in acid resistance